LLRDTTGKPPEVAFATIEAPSSWAVFIKLKDRVSQTEFSKASRYRARLKLASSFKGIVLDNVAPATNGSYFALLKLSLAYSALESLESLTGKNSIIVTDRDFHQSICRREFDKLLRHLISAAKQQSRPTHGELEKYLLEDPDQDLTSIVKHSRHAVFHASITPNSLLLQSSQERRELLIGLANSTLFACETGFDKYVAKVRQRPRTYDPHAAKR